MGKLRPAAIQRGGNVIVLDGTLDGLTPHIVWGGRTEATILMERIKREFDPHGILNPGRFVF
jgi:FAD/FMN-containing dehydrogenase